MTKTEEETMNRQVFKLEPQGLMDRTSKRVMAHAGAEVQTVKPTGCPAPGAMGQAFVQLAETGQFIGLVSKASLVKLNKTAPVRDLAAEARDARSAAVMGRVR